MNISLTFQEQVVLLIVDKLAIGSIIALVGFIGLRITEKYKARQTLIVEITKTRISKLSNIWERVDRLTRDADALVKRRYDLEREEGCKIISTYPVGRLTPTQMQELSITVKQRVQHEIIPNIEQLLSEYEELSRQISDSYFWVGKRFLDPFVSRIYTLKQYIELLKTHDELLWLITKETEFHRVAKESVRLHTDIEEMLTLL